MKGWWCIASYPYRHSGSSYSGTSALGRPDGFRRFGPYAREPSGPGGSMHIGLVSHSSDHRANPKDTRIQGARVTASVVVSAVLKDHAGTGGVSLQILRYRRTDIQM